MAGWVVGTGVEMVEMVEMEAEVEVEVEEEKEEEDMGRLEDYSRKRY